LKCRNGHDKNGRQGGRNSLREGSLEAAGEVRENPAGVDWEFECIPEQSGGGGRKGLRDGRRKNGKTVQRKTGSDKKSWKYRLISLWLEI